MSEKKTKTATEQSAFAKLSNGQTEGVCEIGLRNLQRATKRNAARLTIEAPDEFVEQLIRQAMGQPVDKRITHVWLGWRCVNGKAASL